MILWSIQPVLINLLKRVMTDTIDCFAIALNGINKYFGAVHANRNISLKIRRGAIHGIVGENGAGKSTLMSILFGFYRADSGEMFINGKKIEIRSSQDALREGIAMVHQHFMLVENLTVLENIILGAEGGPMLRSGFSRARRELKRLDRDYGLSVPLEAKIENLPVGQQQRVEILKALYRGADTLILDEPTGVLTPSEADHLFEILRNLKAENKTIILITHKLREIMDVTDSVSVMRQGEIVTTLETSKTSAEDIAELMVGRRVPLRGQKPPPIVAGKTVLEVKGLVVKDNEGTSRVKDISFSVRAGEIVGIAGVAGNGQSELLEALTGLREWSEGQVILNGEEIKRNERCDPHLLREKHVAHVPEDRHRLGMVMGFAAYENAILGHQDEKCYGRGLLLDKRTVMKETLQKMETYDIRPPNPYLKSSLFSGGNQQKLVVAREFGRNPELLLVGQPTRGVDIGAIEFIHSRILDLRSKGKAILLVSVELDEIRALADRVLVMFAGRIMGECKPEAAEREMGMLMAGLQADIAA